MSKMTEQASCFPLLREHSRHPPEPVRPLKLLRSNRKQANKPEGLSAKLRVRGARHMERERGKEGLSQGYNLEIMLLRIFLRKPVWYISILKLMAYTSSKMLFPANCTDN